MAANLPSTTGTGSRQAVAPISKRITNGPRQRRAGANHPKTRPFVTKLWSLVNDPENSQFIHWMPDGKSFQVVGREQFEKNVLPKYFKHTNFSSFVRQLNMYGYHKVQDVTSGAMNTGEEKWQFQSPNFIRGRQDLLDNIVRNKSSKGSDDEDEVDLSRILEEINLIKENQMSIADDLYRIRKDNEMLWTENLQSQERHKKHAETLDRILRFLASVYGSQGKLLADMISPHKQQQRLLMPSDSPLPASEIVPIVEEPSADTPPITSSQPDNSKGFTPSRHTRIMSVNSATPSVDDNNDLSLGDGINDVPMNPGSLALTTLPGTAGSAGGPQQRLFTEPSFYNADNGGSLSALQGLDSDNDDLLDRINNSQDDIVRLARSIDTQGSQLAQVEDWMQQIVPGYQADSESPNDSGVPSATMATPAHGGPHDSNFNVDEFLVDPAATPVFDIGPSVDDFNMPAETNATLGMAPIPDSSVNSKKRKLGG